WRSLVWSGPRSDAAVTSAPSAARRQSRERKVGADGTPSHAFPGRVVVVVGGPAVVVVVVSVVEVVVLVVVVVVGPVHAESSEVLSSGAIAVAVRTVPAASGWAKLTVKLASPSASVMTLSLAPTKVWPSPLPEGSHASLAKTSTRKVVFGVELSVPSTLVPPGKSPAASTGKFWRPLAPVSGSWKSFAFTPGGWRSMPSPPLAKTELLLMKKPESDDSTKM